MSKIINENQLDYLNNFRNEKDDLLIEMEEYARANKIPILDWLSSEFLEHMILTARPKRVLEIGTAIAYSSIRIARSLRKKGIVDTIEKSEPNIETAYGFIKRTNLESKINILEGDALDLLPRLSKKYDFIFLDADKEDYETLFHFALMLLKKKGIIFIDNLLWKGYAASKSVPNNFKISTQHVRKFNDVFMNQKNLKAFIYPIGDGIGIGVKC